MVSSPSIKKLPPRALYYPLIGVLSTCSVSELTPVSVLLLPDSVLLVAPLNVSFCPVTVLLRLLLVKMLIDPVAVLELAWL